MIDLIAAFTVPAAMRVLGDPKFDSKEARAMLLAIGLQESGFEHRVQVQGPARGFWQFEEGGGVKGVLMHAATSAPALEAMATLKFHEPGEPIEDTITRAYGLLETNETLAAVFARLLLWTSPKALPNKYQYEIGWSLYNTTWRPGKPHPETWEAHYMRAWEMV